MRLLDSETYPPATIIIDKIKSLDDLRITLLSATHQRYLNTEIIVINDANTPEIEQFLKEKIDFFGNITEVKTQEAAEKLAQKTHITKLSSGTLLYRRKILNELKKYLPQS